jgi:trypsin-like peptidase/colicin V production protein
LHAGEHIPPFAAGTLPALVTAIDWIIVGFTALMALWGFAQGLIVGALSLAGFVAGAVVGSRLGPALLEEGSHSPYAPLSALVGALALGGILASGLELLGFHLRGRLGDRFGVLDGAGGAVLVGCLGLGLMWLAGAVALQTPGARQLREPIQRSAILRQLNEHLPPSGPILRALARFDPFPRIQGPAPNVRAPDARIARDPDVRRARRSVVRVLGTACGLGVQGSGWVAGDGLVVTNAHVVAGQDDTTVQLRGEGDHFDAQAVAYDPRNDLAILRVSGIEGVPALGLDVNAGPGTSGAVLGFPEHGPFDVEPGRLGQTTTVTSEDAYGRGPVRRRITSLRGLVRSGNSGGPMVDGRGRVLTTIFAATLADHGRTGFGVPDSIVRAELQRARGPVDTGPCAR